MNDVIIMKFDTESKSYQAFSKIKKLHASKQIVGEQMAVLEHKPNHLLNPKDFIDFTGGDKNLKGGLIGMLIGIIAGPLGILLGWFAGSMIGASKDVKEVKGALSIFEETIKTIPEGETGVILITEEFQTGPIDDIVINELGGVVVRLDRADVEKDIQEAKETQEEVEEEAQKRWFQKHQR